MVDILELPHSGVTNGLRGADMMTLKRAVNFVGPKAYHPSFDDDQLMKLNLLMILC